MVSHNSTWTTFSHGVKDWWESPSGTVVRIELLVAVVAICMLLLAACGSLRRRSQSFFAQRVVLAAYLSTSLVSYTLGSMQSSPVKSNMYPFWAVSLYMLSGSVESITAYSLDDNSQQNRQIYETTLCMFYAVLIAVTVLNNGIGISIFIELACLAGLKSMQRHWASIVAVGSWNLNKMVSDYMHHEHTKSESSAYDPVSMKGYRYLVHWPLHKSKLEAGTLYEAQVTTEEADAAARDVVDIEKIWQCESLSSEQKDTCLSLSLFHLLRRRFFGFACAESSQKKTHDFVFKGLLAKNKDGNMDYNRVFKVIEVELAFMYDFFFTMYASIHYAPWGPRMVIYMLITLAFLEVPTANIRTIDTRNWSPVATAGPADLTLTLVMFTSFLLLEFVQQLLYSTTIWGTVYLAYKQSVKRAAIRTTINHNIARMCTSVSNKCYWQNKLGQYSLLESVRYNDPNSSKARLRAICMKFIRACFKLVSYEIIHPFINFSIRRKVISKPGDPVQLSAEVKDALVQSLELTQGVLTNGQLSLRSNGADNLLWACRNGDTHPASSSICILTWHIATCYCEMATRVGGAAFKHHIDVATKLSKYCAYLMVKEPKLLPGHHYDTIRVFDAVAEEALVFLQTQQNKYEAMEGLAKSLSETAAASLPGSNDEKIFHMGVRLGKQLEGMEEGARWKVLAEFWAEMLLYLAPSDNVKAHVECLAKGGELITHLWALLTHAGILDRSQRNVANDDIENAGTGQGQPAYTGEGSSYGSHSRSQAAPDTHAPYQPATSPNLEQSGGTMVQQRANQVQNVERSPIARTAPSDVKEIEIITSEE